MNLVIDQGNTNVKIAVFQNGIIMNRFTEKEMSLNTMKNILREFPGIKRSILSSVNKFNEDISHFLSSAVSNFIVLDQGTPIPIKNNYTTKDTLGYDRIANAVAAHSLFPGNNVLIIDTGTAITIDFISSNSEFLGGNISPGLDLRLKSLNNYTAKLPLVEKQENFEILGTSTHGAILSGVLNAVIFELDGYISLFSEKYPDLKTILTGGDLNYFVKKLKNIIFVESNLNLIGLNRILEFNDN